MARSRKLEVVVAGDAKGLSRTFKKAGDDADHLEKRMHGIGGRIGGAFKLAGVAAGGALAVGLKKSVDAAIEAEKSQARLETQLKASGISYREHAAAIDEAIQKTSRLAGLDDEDLQDAFTNIVRVTGDVNKSLKLTGLAADFARAKHIDVAKAGEIVGKVAGGNTGVLGRYGIKIKEGATATEALGKLQQKFSGQAEAYGKTTAGAQDRFRVAVENLQEKIGEKLLPVLTKVADKAAKFVDEMSRGTGAGGRFADKLKDIADKVRPIAKFFTDHPKLIAIAVGAWATYRLAAAAALTVSRLKLIGMFAGLGPKAAAGGAVAGRSFGTAASTGAIGGFRGTPGRMGRLRSWSTAGRIAGFAFATAMALEFAKPIGEGIGHALSGAIQDLKNRDDLIGKIFRRASFPGERNKQTGPGISLEDLGIVVPPSLPPGRRPIDAPKGPPAPPRRPRPASGPGQNDPAGGARAHISSRPTDPAGSPAAEARARARRWAALHDHPIIPDVRSPTPRRQGVRRGSRKEIVGPVAHSSALAGRKLSGRQIAALWEGAGGDPGSTDIAVAVALAESGGYTGASNQNTNGSIDRGVWQINSVHGALSTFDPRANAASAVRISGNGSNWSPWVTYQNGAYRRFLGQSGSGSGGSVGSVASGGTTAPVVRRAPLPLTATLVGGAGGGSKAPRGMGGRVPADRAGGFFPAISREQIDVLSGDPKTNPKSRIARLFQLGVRRNKIISDLTSGKVKTQATRDRLLDDLAGIDSEIADLTETTGGLENIPGAAAYLGSLDKEAALAELTPDTADDQDVARRVLAARQGILAYAQSHGFSDTDIAQAARDVKSAQDAVDSGDTATTQLADAIRDFSEQLRRQNDFNDRIAGITGGEAVRALADVISGELGPRVALRGLTPGSGARAAY